MLALLRLGTARGSAAGETACNFNTEMFVSKVGNPCPILGQLLARQILYGLLVGEKLGSRPGKPNQRKGQNEKFMNFAHFCEFRRFSLGKQARFTLNFCSGMPPRKVHELAFLWFGLPGPNSTKSPRRDFVHRVAQKLVNSWSIPCQLSMPWEVAGVFFAVVLWQQPVWEAIK